eukprot:2893858-Pleurochrysis_carterae.AAC.3
MTNDFKYAVAKKLNTKGRAKFLEFKSNLKDILHFHKYKLHSILFDDKLHPAVRRQHAKKLTDEKVAAAEMDWRMKEFVQDCNKDAFAILIIKIADTTLKNRLRRNYDDDAHGAWTYIEHLHGVKDNNTCITKASDERKALVEEGMAFGTEAAARTMVEQLLQLNSDLQGSAHHWSDNFLSTTLLDTLAAHLSVVVRVYKTGKISQSAWRDDFDQVCIEVFSMLEENDQMDEGKNAIDAECWAMRTETVAAEDDLTSLCDEPWQVREQMAATITIKPAMHTTTNAKPRYATGATCLVVVSALAKPSAWAS